MLWKIVPISEGQKKDVRPEDLLNDGHFRKCSTYRGGGGYDKFPDYCEKLLGTRCSEQFIVQLFGCSLDCPYCYVTRAGVWGKWIPYTSNELVEAFKRSGQEVFHLMGGAPALQMQNWRKIIELLPEKTPFHSDLMLVEKDYGLNVLREIKGENCIYAVGIKGLTTSEFFENTRKVFNERRFWDNLEKVLHADLNIYFTFTNVDEVSAEVFMSNFSGYNYFGIDLIEYNAEENIDDVPWGKPAEV